MFHTCENDIHLAASQRVLLRELQGAVKVGIPGRGEECGAGPCGVGPCIRQGKESWRANARRAAFERVGAHNLTRAESLAKELRRLACVRKGKLLMALCQCSIRRPFSRRAIGPRGRAFFSRPQFWRESNSQSCFDSELEIPARSKAAINGGQAAHCPEKEKGESISYSNPVGGFGIGPRLKVLFGKSSESLAQKLALKTSNGYNRLALGPNAGITKPGFRAGLSPFGPKLASKASRCVRSPTFGPKPL